MNSGCKRIQVLFLFFLLLETEEIKPEKYFVRKQQFLILYHLPKGELKAPQWCHPRVRTRLADGPSRLAGLMSQQIMWCSVGSWDWPAESTWITAWSCDGKVGPWAAVSQTSACGEAGGSLICSAPGPPPAAWLTGALLREAAAPSKCLKTGFIQSVLEAKRKRWCWWGCLEALCKTLCQNLGWAALLSMPSWSSQAAPMCRCPPALISVCFPHDVFFWISFSIFVVVV